MKHYLESVHKLPELQKGVIPAEAEILMVQFILHSSPFFDFYLNLKSSL